MDESQLRRELVTIAEDLLSGKREIIDAVREMNSIIHGLPEYDLDDKAFTIIVAIEDETDGVITGASRDLYHPDYLNRTDKKMERFIPANMPHILDACREFVRRYKADGQGYSHLDPNHDHRQTS